MSKTRVKIIGAGSIGNHLAHACRLLGWDVTVVDASDVSLNRMRDEIYPSRYGKWDEQIHLYTPALAPRGNFDCIFIGTPPDTHMALALQAIEEQPRILVIEKPLCQPTEKAFIQLAELSARRRNFSKDTMVLVGYNHLVTPAVQYLADQTAHNTVKNISVRWQESWLGIFKAHPWLKGPWSSYLGFTDRGGGASGEHSHGLNLCQYLAHRAGWGRIVQVSSDFHFVQEDNCNYDITVGFRMTTESGHKCDVFQDVVTEPAIKKAHVQTLQLGNISWSHRGEGTHDTVMTPDHGGEYAVKMTRPDDFKYEVAHIADLLSDREHYADSPLHIKRGIETMQVLYYARRSSAAKGTPMDVPKWFSEF